MELLDNTLAVQWKLTLLFITVFVDFSKSLFNSENKSEVKFSQKFKENNYEQLL